MIDIPRGKHLGERLGDGPATLPAAAGSIAVNSAKCSSTKGRSRTLRRLEAARLIKSKNPHSMVEVKDLQSGDVTALALRSR